MAENLEGQKIVETKTRVSSKLEGWLGYTLAAITLGFIFYSAWIMGSDINKLNQEKYQTLSRELRQYDINKNGVLEPTEVKALLSDYAPKNR